VEFSAIETSIRNLCSDILVEQYRIIDLGVPTGFRDLFLEQGMYSTALYFCNTKHNIPLNMCPIRVSFKRDGNQFCTNMFDCEGQ
jgi:hypothetical protein